MQPPLIPVDCSDSHSEMPLGREEVRETGWYVCMCVFRVCVYHSVLGSVVIEETNQTGAWQV